VAAETRAADSFLTGDLAVFTPPAQYRRPLLIRFILLLIVTVAFLASDWGRTGMTTVLAWVTGPAAAWCGILYCWRGRFRTVVSRDGIEVYGYFRHFVPWHEVARMEVRGRSGMRLDDHFRVSYLSRAFGDRPVPRVPCYGGAPSDRARLATVRLIRTSGSGLPLRAPVVTEWAADPYFGDKARQLQQLCGQFGAASGRY
jgi:hypothetical protein